MAWPRIVAYIVSENTRRRHLTAGQRHMWLAMIYPKAEKGGRGKTGGAQKLAGTGEFSHQRLGEARAILEWSQTKAAEVLAGAIRPDRSGSFVLRLPAIIGYIVSENIRRRHLNAGQRAILIAIAYPEPTPGKRNDLVQNETGSTVSRRDLSHARCICKWAPEMVEEIAAVI